MDSEEKCREQRDSLIHHNTHFSFFSWPFLLALAKFVSYYCLIERIFKLGSGLEITYVHTREWIAEVDLTQEFMGTTSPVHLISHLTRMLSFCLLCLHFQGQD